MEQVLANQSRFPARAPIGSPLTEYYGVEDKILKATHFHSPVVQTRTGTRYFFLEEVQAFMSFY